MGTNQNTQPPPKYNLGNHAGDHPQYENSSSQQTTNQIISPPLTPALLIHYARSSQQPNNASHLSPLQGFLSVGEPSIPLTVCMSQIEVPLNPLPRGRNIGRRIWLRGREYYSLRWNDLYGYEMNTKNADQEIKLCNRNITRGP